jgi:hypothetical protein
LVIRNSKEKGTKVERGSELQILVPRIDTLLCGLIDWGVQVG